MKFEVNGSFGERRIRASTSVHEPEDTTGHRQEHVLDDVEHSPRPELEMWCARVRVEGRDRPFRFGADPRRDGVASDACRVQPDRMIAATRSARFTDHSHPGKGPLIAVPTVCRRAHRRAPSSVQAGPASAELIPGIAGHRGRSLAVAQQGSPECPCPAELKLSRCPCPHPPIQSATITAPAETGSTSIAASPPLGARQNGSPAAPGHRLWHLARRSIYGRRIP